MHQNLDLHDTRMPLQPPNQYIMFPIPKYHNNIMNMPSSQYFNKSNLTFRDLTESKIMPPFAKIHPHTTTHQLQYLDHHRAPRMQQKPQSLLRSPPNQQ
jgi:hypothetical protein